MFQSNVYFQLVGSIGASAWSPWKNLHVQRSNMDNDSQWPSQAWPSLNDLNDRCKTQVPHCQKVPYAIFICGCKMCTFVVSWAIVLMDHAHCRLDIHESYSSKVHFGAILSLYVAASCAASVKGHRGSSSTCSDAARAQFGKLMLPQDNASSSLSYPDRLKDVSGV